MKTKIAIAKNRIDTTGRYLIDLKPRNTCPEKLPKLAPKFWAVVLNDKAVSRYFFVNLVISITPKGPVIHWVAFHKNRIIQKTIILILEIRSAKIAEPSNKSRAN